ncbi:MAG: trypsin-like peptidase domain-containing protein [Spirochaetales bacterium]|uniref:Trypsin-like peptidase domain-containing protein n=1 Tax=Candidatus Thalassospirochaeta sargassi TaxID=3119039 RepID=A0AAJ1IHC2_9SPIO|nr:trypsin-like peptidase domain-containing protein [Spirochaetales bacterium]
MRKTTIFFLLVFASITNSIYAADWASIVREFGPAVAKITVTDGKGAVISQGTGFMVENAEGKQRMVSNAHVVAEAEHSDTATLSAEFLYPNDSEESIPLMIEMINREQDLCFLKLEGDAPAVLELSDGQGAGLMEEIIVIGYPLGRNFKTTPGYLQAYQDIEGIGRMLDLSAVVAPGNSGGPVLDTKGRVIGVITAVIHGFNFNLAIPVSNLSALMESDSEQIDVSLNSSPDGAWVFVDGAYKGKTPLELELFNREYKLRIEKEEYEVFETEIGPWKGQSEKADFALVKEIDDNPVIEIIAIPSKARISVNNRELDADSATVQYPSGSILRILLTAPGYKEKLEFYEVTEDPEQRVEIELEGKFKLW